MQDDFKNQMWNFMQNFHDGLLIPPPGEEKEPEATTDTELSSTKDIHPLPVQEPPLESDICQLIEECCVEASKEQKQKMEDTILEMVKICQEKEFFCIHDDVDDLIKSALNSKLLLINPKSQHPDKKEREVKNVEEQQAERRNRAKKSLQNFRVVHKSSISVNSTSQISSVHAVAQILSTREPKHLLSMGYEHLSITPETESDEVTESNAENFYQSQNFRVIHKSSISVNSTSQISSVHAVAQILSTREPKHLLSMGYEHLSITPETESDEVTESNAENFYQSQVNARLL
nr:hypothetical protein [Tanacetum cinerariifolium]